MSTSCWVDFERSDMTANMNTMKLLSFLGTDLSVSSIVTNIWCTIKDGDVAVIWDWMVMSHKSNALPNTALVLKPSSEMASLETALN